MPITLASLLVAVVVTGLGIYVVGKGPTRPWRLIGAGTAMGMGVAAMSGEDQRGRASPEGAAA